jgi:hypothetical protein
MAPRIIALIALLCALLAPAGGTSFAMVICGAEGGYTIWLPDDDSPPHPAHACVLCAALPGAAGPPRSLGAITIRIGDRPSAVHGRAAAEPMAPKARAPPIALSL